MLQPRIWPDDIPEFPIRIDADWKLASTVDDQSFLLGVNSDGMLVSWKTAITPSLLIQGRAGSGKSSLMQVPAVEALIRNYKVVVADPIKGADDFRSWAEKRSVSFIGQGDFRGTEAVVLWVENEISRRINLLMKNNAPNINSLAEPERPQRILLVFDEFGGYMKSIKELFPNPNGDASINQINRQIKWKNDSILRTCAALARIAVKGRTVGVNLLLGAQHLVRDDFHPIIGGNMFFKSLGKIVLGRMTLTDIVEPQNITEANLLQGKMDDAIGRGIYETCDGRMTDLQSWWSGGNVAIEDVLAGAPIMSAVPPVEKIDFGSVKPELTYL